MMPRRGKSRCWHANCFIAEVRRLSCLAGVPVQLQLLRPSPSPLPLPPPLLPCGARPPLRIRELSAAWTRWGRTAAPTEDPCGSAVLEQLLDEEPGRAGSIPTVLSSRVVLSTRGGISARLARIGQGTLWLDSSGGGVSPGERTQERARAVALGEVLTQALVSSATRWVVEWVSADTPWRALGHPALHAPWEVARHLRIPGRRRWFASGTELTQPGRHPFEIAPATPMEKALLLASLDRHRDASYRDALDLVPGRLDISVVQEAWKREGVHRERGILVARWHGHPFAALLLDHLAGSSSFPEGLNTARPVRLMRGGEAAWGPLADVASLWFSRRGASRFSWLEEGDGPEAELDRPALGDEEGEMLLLPRSLLCECLERLEGLSRA